MNKSEKVLQLCMNINEAIALDPKNPRVGDVFTTIRAKGFKVGENWPKHQGIRIEGSSTEELRAAARSKGLRLQEATSDSVSYGFQLAATHRRNELMSDALINADGFYLGYRRNGEYSSLPTFTAGPFVSADQAINALTELQDGYDKSRTDMMWQVRNGQEIQTKYL